MDNQEGGRMYDESCGWEFMRVWNCAPHEVRWLLRPQPFRAPKPLHHKWLREQLCELLQWWLSMSDHDSRLPIFKVAVLNGTVLLANGRNVPVAQPDRPELAECGTEISASVFNELTFEVDLVFFHADKSYAHLIGRLATMLANGILNYTTDTKAKAA